MADRVAVFLDYQNLYHGARETFHRQSGPGYLGNVDPVLLADRLVSDSPFERELAEVRIYRGEPSNKRDPKGYAAARRHYDVGIVFSTDTDIEPALEHVAKLTNKNGSPRPEVAAWSAPGRGRRRLAVPNRNLYCHWIDRDTYLAVQDTTNYARAKNFDR